MKLINRVITGGYWGAYYLVYVLGVAFLVYYFWDELLFLETRHLYVETLFLIGAIYAVSAGTALFVAIIVEVTGRMVLLIPRAWNRAKDEGRAEGLAQGLTAGRAEGLAQGRTEGHTEGRATGLTVGRAEGRAEGLTEGLTQGLTQGMTVAAKAALTKAAPNGTGCKPSCPNTRGATRKPGASSWTRMPRNACSTARASMRAGNLSLPAASLYLSDRAVWPAGRQPGPSRRPNPPKPRPIRRPANLPKPPMF